MNKRVLAALLALAVTISGFSLPGNVSAAQNTEMTLSEETTEQTTELPSESEVTENEETESESAGESTVEETEATEDVAGEGETTEAPAEQKPAESEETEQVTELPSESKETESEVTENEETESEGAGESTVEETEATEEPESSVEETEATEEPESSVEKPELSVKGANSAGTLFAEEFSQLAAEQLENNGCNIFSVEMTGTEAFVSFETTRDASLVIGVYEEDGIKMLASGSVEVSRGQTEVVVDIETASMPQYFYIRGFLVETDTLRPVCTSYESSLYTQEMQDFLSKTTEDFDADKVLNLDDDITNNFAVYNDDVILIPSGTGKNEVSSIDEAADTYVITDADVSMTSLQPGDTFAYEYETGQVLIVKIAEISVDGTTVTITGADAALEDVFSYVKIDAEEGLGNAVIDPSTCGEGVTYEGLVDAAADSDFKAYGVDAGGSMEKAFRMKLDKKVESGAGSFTVSGGLDMKLTCSAKLYLSFSQQYVELKLDYSAKLGVSASGSGSIDVPLVTVGYMFCGVIVELTPSIVAEADASIALQGTLKGAVGFCATKNGMENLTSMPTLETEFKSQGSIFIGFSLEPRVKILTEKVASASLTAKVGVEVTAVLDYHRSESGEVLHTCSSCVDGDIYARVNLDAAAKLLNKESLTFRIRIADEKEKVADFYYSVDHDEFGLSSCPYLSFRIQAAVTDTAGKPVSGAVIDGKYTTDENGKAEFYLPNGSYRLKTEKAGYPAGTYRLLVAGRAETIRILLKKSGGSGDIPIEPVLPDDSADTAVTQRQMLNLGGIHSGAITNDGSLYMWGGNYDGQLGDGTTTNKYTPVKVLEDVVSVSLGGFYSSGAITGDGSLYMWGNNHYGQLGDGTTDERHTPVKVLEDVVSVSLGDEHSGAITSDGSLYMWGWNYGGQLGDGTTDERHTPVKVLDNVIAVSLERNHSGAITGDGSLYMWGNNHYGQLGDGTTTERYTPVKVLENVVSVSLGGLYSGAITSDGSLYMWGRNNYGQLGDGTTTDRHTPIKVLEDVVSVSLSDHSGAITSDGSLHMWGRNDYGQLGDGTTMNRHTPVKVLENAVSVSLGGFHSGAITSDGSLYMWGCNGDGLLGDGTTTDRHTPTKISLPGGVALPDGTKASVLSVEAEAEPIAVNKADSVSAVGDVQEASFRDLTPEGIYQFYVAKSLTAEQLLAPENLLYVAQAAADASGRLTVSYEPRETYEGAAVFVVGGAKRDIAGASVTVPTVSYAGGTQTILPQVTLDGRTLVEGRDYQLTGGFLVTAPGSYTLTVSGIGNYTGTVQTAYQVVCVHQYTETVTRQPTCTQTGERTLRCGICGDSYTEAIPAAGHTYTSEWTTDRKPTCTQAGSKSRHCTVCGASADVTAIPATGHNYQDTKVIKKATTTKSGKVKQTCSVCGASKTETISAAKKTALSATALTYNGKNRTPGVTVTDAKGRKLKKGTDYTVSYPKSRKNVGKYTVTIKLKGKYSGTVKKTFTVKPKSTSVTKLSSSGKNITVKWKKQKKQTTGYEVQYSTSSKFTKKTTHTVRIAKNGTTSKKITGLKAKKKYYVRVRTYKTVRINKKSTRIYSDWSKAKKITTKK